MDWKQRYEELAKLFIQYQTHVRNLTFLEYKIECHLTESHRLDLQDRGVKQYLQLTEDVTITTRFDSGRTGRTETYQKGTLINAVVHNETAIVYLDDDGDGYLDFPADKLVMVEFPNDQVPDNVIWQG